MVRTDTVAEAHATHVDASHVDATHVDGLIDYLPRIASRWLEETPDQLHRRVDGTLLFVDVSGFTALTERLASRGKVGAEEITDVIGAVFGELLGVASSYGADLLKWGGDAVLLYFDEPGSAARAARAAKLMTATMNRIGRYKTSRGRITLRVSIGGHRGAFELYLLGSLHRELIVTGPSASVTARMEAIAEAGEVVISPAMAHELDPAVVGEAKGEGILLAAVPDADPEHGQSLGPLGPAPLDVSPLLPTDRRLHLLGGGEQAEHRQATVAFLEFSGVDALTAQGGAPLVASYLAPVIAATQEAAERHGVNFHETDIGPDGGKIVLLGGVPVLRGNDSARALRAVHEVVAGHPPDSPIRLRAGVNSGRVFVFSHNFVRARRRVFAVTGDTVNLAARVMGRAPAGQIVATEMALVQARHPFDIEAIPPFRVKGKSEPVIAATLGRPRFSLTDKVDDDVSFVGREREIADLLGWAEEAAAGSGTVVEITGPSGIGKSRLATEAAERWSLVTYRVSCERNGAAIPYRPFRRLLRALLDIGDDAADAVVADELRRTVRTLVPHLEPLLPLLADVVDTRVASTPEVDELEPQFRRERLEGCAVELIGARLTEPSALVFDDAQDLDEASSSLLAKLAAMARRRRLLVVVTCGPGGQPPLPDGVGRRMVLARLDDGASQRLAQNASGSLAPTELDFLVRRAGGNPLFLRELIRTSQEAGGVDALPESLESLLVAQIDLLAPRDRHVLRAAAVLGNSFDPREVEDVLLDGEPLEGGTWERLAPFVVPAPLGASSSQSPPSGSPSSGPLTAGSALSGRGSATRQFAHGLMRDAAYEGLPFKRRKELHRRAAHAIESRSGSTDDEAGVLSLHWLRAEQFDKAWRSSCVAGDRARALWANADAATFYSRALDAAARIRLRRDEVAVVAEALGDVCELSASYVRARQAYGRARRMVETPTDRARLLRKMGVLHERDGHYGSALACYSRARRLVSGTSRSEGVERCELDLASAGICSRQGRYADCARFAHDAARVAGRVRHRAGLAHALYLEQVAGMYLGSSSDVLARRSLAIFEQIGDLVGQANVLNNLGIGAYYRGRWDESVDAYERSRMARLRAGDIVGAATQENNIAEILSDQGRFIEARPLFEAARATWQSARYRVGMALATSNLGRLCARSGDVVEGRALLEAALADFQEIRSPIFIAETRLRLAECEVLAGRLTEAVRAAEELLADVHGRVGLEQVEMGVRRIQGSALGLMALERHDARPEGRGPDGRVREATDALADAAARAVALEAPYELALALATRVALRHVGVVGGATDAREAQEIFARLGVEESAITWASGPGRGPLFAIGPRRSVPAT
jgi:class 3 adenylate cyclase/tetratricopeptide (TPR) repeat protein